MQQLLEQFHDLNLTLSSNFNASISDLLAHLPAFSLPSLPAVMTPDPAVGALLAQKGLRAKHTVVIVPGAQQRAAQPRQGIIRSARAQQQPYRTSSSSSTSFTSSLPAKHHV